MPRELHRSTGETGGSCHGEGMCDFTLWLIVPRSGHVWFVDPLVKTLEVLRLDGSGYSIVGAWHGKAVVQCEPFESLPIQLADSCSA